MVGRSNRARGACEATLYVVGEERQAQVSERLRRHGIMALMDQERLLEILERKGRDQQLLRCLMECREKGHIPKSLEELRANIGEQGFNKIMK
jgi:hypothetical protein